MYVCLHVYVCMNVFICVDGMIKHICVLVVESLAYVNHVAL